jgi:hypothetical protein
MPPGCPTVNVQMEHAQPGGFGWPAKLDNLERLHSVRNSAPFAFWPFHAETACQAPWWRCISLFPTNHVAVSRWLPFVTATNCATTPPLSRQLPDRHWQAMAAALALLHTELPVSHLAAAICSQRNRTGAAVLRVTRAINSAMYSTRGIGSA